MTPVEQFAADYFVRERLSPSRRQFVLRALREFAEFGGAPPENLHDEQLQLFLNSLVEAGRDVNYVRKYNHAIKPFYKWAWKVRIIGSDQYMRIKDVPNPRGASGEAKPRPYKRTEIAQLWVALDAAWPVTEQRFIDRWQRGTSPYRRVWKHAMHLQTEATIGLALFAGLRQAEIFNLSIDDLHPDNDYIVVRGKTVVHADAKVREVPYTEYGRDLVAKWLAFRELMAPAHDRPWLVVDNRASMGNVMAPSHPLNPISASSFSTLMRRVGPGWEFHRLRHTCATEWLRAGMELERVSKLLGHASIEQTLGYAKLVREDVQRSMRRHEESIVGHLGRAA